MLVQFVTDWHVEGYKTDSQGEAVHNMVDYPHNCTDWDRAVDPSTYGAQEIQILSRCQASLETLDGCIERTVYVAASLYLVARVEHRRVILAAELCAHFAQREIRQLPAEVHGNLAREGD